MKGETASGIVKALRQVVGDEHVLSSTEDCENYSRCTIPWSSQCTAVVFPGNTEEVSAVLRVANQYRIPVWPHSRGRNWGYGTTLTIQDGAIVMILERMNRILEVNEELAYAVIEPGVSYAQLNAFLRHQGYALWVDCIDGTPHGSVIGNALERGVGETPYGDHFGNLCGMEVVLPDGETVQIGAAVENVKTWHTHKWGVGPYMEGLFSQSNLGVVTQAGIWLMPRPEAYNSYVYEIRNEAHLPQVLDTFRQLALSGVVNTKLHMINDFVTLSVLTQRIREDVPQDRPLTESGLARLRKKYGIPAWSCAGGIYGTSAQVRLQRSLLRKALSPYGRLLFLSDWQLPFIERAIGWSWKHPLFRRVTESLARTSLPVMEIAPYVHKILQGIPTEFFVKHAYYRFRQPRPENDIHPAHDGCGLIWVAPILPFVNAEVWPYLESCKNKFAHHGFDFYVAMLLMNPRSVICLMAILFDRENPDEVMRARQLHHELIADMQQRRLQPYRTGLLNWLDLFEKAPPLAKLQNKIKSSLDPKGILAPGHYGVQNQPPSSSTAEALEKN